MAGPATRPANNFRRTGSITRLRGREACTAAALLLVVTVTVRGQSLPGGSADKEGVSTDRLAALDRRFQAGVEAGERDE